ncbi:MAG: LppX_LprAFG lipoprotein [Butyricicoccus pullicaecorum]|nr:LppX_LprAFG lipoprotein [Butyricicoccus pullicaecorum]
MNMTKRITASLTAMTLCFSLAACGGNGGNAGDDAAKGKTPAEQVAAAVEKLNAAKSFSISMQQDIGMSMKVADQSQDLNYAINMDMDVFQNPMKAKGKVTVDMGDLGGKQETEMYMQETDDEAFIYVGMNGQGVNQSADVEGMEMYDVQDTMDLYLDNASDFKEAGSEQVNGADATKISGVIKGDKLEEVLEESGIMNMVEQFAAAGATEAEKMLSNLGDMPMTVWVSAEGYPIQYEMDMTAMLSGIMDSALKAAGAAEQGVSMQVSKAKIGMTCSNFDSAPDFELPAELENATDMAA